MIGVANGCRLLRAGNPLQKAKRAKVAEVEKHNAELTKLVNARNEQLHAALAGALLQRGRRGNRSHCFFL